MKKLFVILMAICVLAGFAIAGNKPYFFPFIGKWQPAEDPLHIDDYGFQDIQNLRKDGKRLKGVGGHTKINTNAWNATYSYPKSGFHFKKARPSESHVIIYATDSAGSGGRLYQNTTAIPATGDFVVTTIHTDATGAGLGRFSSAPQGQMIYNNGAESLLWGGDEISPLAFITSTADVANSATNPTDYTDAVGNESDDRRDLAIIGGGIDANTKLMLHCDGADTGTTFTDDGDTTHAITAVGNAQTDTAFKKFGTASGLFDGAGDYIWAGDHADFNYAAAEFTLDFWIRFENISGMECIYSQTDGVGDADYLSIWMDHDNNELTLSSVSAAANVVLEQVTWAPAADTWYHFAVIRGWGGTVNDWAITVDGATIHTFTDNATLPDLGDELYLAGWVDTTSTLDFSENGYPVLDDNGAILSTTAKWGDGSLYTDGTNDDWKITNLDTFDLCTAGDRTIDFWVKFADHDGIEMMVEQEHDADNGWFIYHTHGDGLRFLMEEATVTEIDSGGGVGEITDTDWHHIALIKVGDDYGIYLDGTQVDVVNDSDTHALDSPNYVYLGRQWAGGASTSEFEGNIDEMRFQEGNPFTAAPAGGADTIVVPTTYHTRDTDTQLLIHGDFGYVDGFLDEFRLTKGAARWIAAFTPSLRAYRDDARYWLVGAQQPLEGVKYYIKTANSVASILTGREWDGGGWTSLTITDNTDTGASLATTGTVTWTLTGNAKKRFLEDYSLYWYLFYLNAGDAEIYQVTIDAPMDDIPNIWDGSEIPVAGCKFWDNSDGEFDDYTDLVQSEVVTDVVDISSAEIADYLLVGYTEPVQAQHIFIPAGKGNANASVMTVAYWAGSAWSTAPNLNDGTDESGDTLSTNGYVSYNPPGESEEFERTIKGETPLYWYKISWSGEIDDTTEIYLIKGVPNPTDISDYKFSALFQNRSFLFADMDGLRNRAIYSAENAPYIYNGDDSGYLDFGAADEELTAAATIYNVFLSTGYEQLIVTKANETYRVFGDNPTNWNVDQISGNIGCIAPLSMAVCEIADVSQEVKRHVAIWQSSIGVVMCDGATVQPISDDIRNYWDANSSDYIPVNRQDDSVAWYDPKLQSYKLLISSGAGQATHNVELEYNLKNNEWTKIYREDGSGANPLQVGLQVKDTIGAVYTYGANNSGQLYRLENGNDWDGTDITQYVHTKDMLLDDGPFQMSTQTVVDYFQIIYTRKSAGDVSVIHYCNASTGITTSGGSDYQSIPAAIDMDSDGDGYHGNSSIQDCTLGPCLLHSFKLQSDQNVADGMELLGMGLIHDPSGTITE